MKNVLVFCSANDVGEKYIKPAREFGKLLAKNGFGLVYGGSDTGLMKIVASSVTDSKGKIIGISMTILKHLARKGVAELIITKDLRERKEMMLKRADAIVVLIGGIGTLDEITEILELKKHKLHDKPIAILNTENFYEGIKVQLQKMKDEGFITRPLEELIYFADSPKEVLAYLDKKMK